MRVWMVAAVVLGGAVAGCDCGGGGSASMDGATSDGSTSVDGAATVDGAALVDGSTSVDGAATLDGGPTVCVPIQCQTHLYQCGNCMDDDGDGRVDNDDPDCLNPCDNNEAGFYLDIPGSPPTNCGRDCYYDQDDGPGNDGCRWDFQCDPLQPGPARCRYSDPPPRSAECPVAQSTMCHDVCDPLTPNGCDCFGCCELPARSGNYVYIGSTDMDRSPTCSLGHEREPARCHPCTPVTDCLNTCERCELCLGRRAEDLPADCSPPPPGDAGMPPPDSGSPADGGSPPPPTCSDGRQACGLPGLSPCPAGDYCITGCCTYFG